MPTRSNRGGRREGTGPKPSTETLRRTYAVFHVQSEQRISRSRAAALVAAACIRERADFLNLKARRKAIEVAIERAVRATKEGDEFTTASLWSPSELRPDEPCRGGCDAPTCASCGKLLLSAHVCSSSPAVDLEPHRHCQICRKSALDRGVGSWIVQPVAMIHRLTMARHHVGWACSTMGPNTCKERLLERFLRPNHWADMDAIADKYGELLSEKASSGLGRRFSFDEGFPGEGSVALSEFLENESESDDDYG